MEALTEFAEGPLLWISMLVFAVGIIYRLVAFFVLAGKRDKVVFEHFNLKYVLLTWLRYLLPFNQTTGKSPLFMIMTYIFHICLLSLPLFLIAHSMYWEEGYFGGYFTDWTIPDAWVPYMTWAVIGIGAIFLIRRLVKPEVRVLNSGIDYFVLVVTVLPFLTGYLTAHTDVLGDYGTLLHILSGELMLVVIPFTKLAHMLLFFPSRMVIGIEWGRRGYSA